MLSPLTAAVFTFTPMTLPNTYLQC